MMRRSLFLALFLSLTSLTVANTYAKSPAQGSADTKGSEAASVPKPEDKVVLDGIRLITSEKEIDANVKSADFTRFVDKVDTAVQYLMYSSPQTTTLLIRFDCTPSGKQVQLMVQDKPEEKLSALLDQLRDAINAIDNMKVKAGTITFSLQYHIKA